MTGVITDHGIIKAPYVIKAAGVYADDIAKMAGDQFYTIHGRKGTIAIMDKAKVPSYPRLVSQLTPEYHKGKNVESKGGRYASDPSYEPVAWSFGDGGAGQRGQQYNEEGFVIR